MKSEKRAVVSLALLYAIRMLGLFMILPVLSIEGLSYNAATAFTLGLVLGIYGLTQAIFQIPLGLLSDYIGRKPVILIGLAIFALGSIVAAVSDSVYGLIIGRALQGSGAIASTVMALLSDLTSEENRTKAMATVGASIGLSFAVALVIGPVLSSAMGLQGIFTATVALSLAGVALVCFVVPTPQRVNLARRDTIAIPRLMKQVLYKPQLMRLNLGIFVLHMVVTAMFVVVPLILLERFSIDPGAHWKVYGPILLLSFVVMVPLMIVAEKKRRVKEAFVSAIALLALTLVFMSTNSALTFFFVFLLFFVAFNLLEAMLPSLVSKTAPAAGKGAAMGVYSTSQFMGAFLGGVAGGLILTYFDASMLLYLCAVVCVVWLFVALSMSRPHKARSLSFVAGSKVADADFSVFSGVKEVVYVEEDQLLYMKVDDDKLDIAALQKLVAQYPV